MDDEMVRVGSEAGWASAESLEEDNDRLRLLMDSVLAFVGVLSPDGVLLEANEPAVAAAGVPRDQLIGCPFWDCYWWSFDAATQDRLRAAVAAAAKGEKVRYDAEIRVAGDHRLWIDFQIVPVADADGRVVELIPSGVDITERKRSEENRELLMNELSHRVKNTLASIQAIAGQTLRNDPKPGAFKEAFNARLRSIAASHDLLVASNHECAGMVELLKWQIGPYLGTPSRLILEGDDVQLPGNAVHTLGLALHELATNAAKYGALSNGDGTVTVRWTPIEDDNGTGKPALDFAWTERGGPEVRPPDREGFGTRLIGRSLGLAGGTDAPIVYDPEGIRVRFTLPLA